MKPSPRETQKAHQNYEKVSEHLIREGYSKKNPNLVARYMEVAGREFTNSTLIKVLWEIAEAIDRIEDND